MTDGEYAEIRRDLERLGLKIKSCSDKETGLRCQVENKTVRIKEDAPTLFTRQYHKEFGRQTPMSRVEREFRETLRELRGKELEIDYAYSDRIVLKYPEEFAKKQSEKAGMNVTSIDLERYLIE
jgi:hypothetical protein